MKNETVPWLSHRPIRRAVGPYTPFEALSIHKVPEFSGSATPFDVGAPVTGPFLGDGDDDVRAAPGEPFEVQRLEGARARCTAPSDVAARQNLSVSLGSWQAAGYPRACRAGGVLSVGVHDMT